MKTLLTVLAIAALANGCTLFRQRDYKADCARYETQRDSFEARRKRWWLESDERKEDWSEAKKDEFMEERGGLSMLNLHIWKNGRKRAYEVFRDIGNVSSDEWQEMDKKYKRVFNTDKPTEFCDNLKAYKD